MLKFLNFFARLQFLSSSCIRDRDRRCRVWRQMMLRVYTLWRHILWRDLTCAHTLTSHTLTSHDNTCVCIWRHILWRVLTCVHTLTSHTLTSHDFTCVHTLTSHSTTPISISNAWWWQKLKSSKKKLKRFLTYIRRLLQHAIVRTHQLVSVGDLCSNLHFRKWGENVRFEPIWDPKFWNLTYYSHQNWLRSP